MDSFDHQFQTHFVLSNSVYLLNKRTDVKLTAKYGDEDVSEQSPQWISLSCRYALCILRCFCLPPGSRSQTGKSVSFAVGLAGALAAVLGKLDNSTVL
jgi:hypothetical protein